MDEATRTYIITELGKQRDRRDVILELCNQHDLDWKEADELVRSVEISDGQKIAKRQSPLLIVLGSGVLLIGLALTVFGVTYFWNWLNLDSVEKLVEARELYTMGATLVTGLAMSTGGVIGLRKILSELF